MKKLLLLAIAFSLATPKASAIEPGIMVIIGYVTAHIAGTYYLYKKYSHPTVIRNAKSQPTKPGNKANQNAIISIDKDKAMKEQIQRAHARANEQPSSPPKQSRGCLESLIIED